MVTKVLPMVGGRYIRNLSLLLNFVLSFVSEWGDGQNLLNGFSPNQKRI